MLCSFQVVSEPRRGASLKEALKLASQNAGEEVNNCRAQAASQGAGNPRRPIMFSIGISKRPIGSCIR
ncbi:hypothetical protein GOP47_0011554 [Adiantum capillus-veneris]|uniref:Uncharacterized protein n=1 Tax=Adiantum capillus-veneris TaxID=13818 RepID=A0A9D4ZHZ2_ADICA|nr:hypothetical protein GOP47_0011554 [Adiantum capillus-veneris]